MRVDRTHLPWAAFVVLATVGVFVLYLANFHPESLSFHVTLPAIFGEVPPRRATIGGTPLGLALGVLAYLIFFFASALGIRKKRRTLPVGSVRTWLRAHIWLSVLTLPLVLFHSGFHLGGQHTSWLMVLYGVVMISGVYGLVLQQFMPRIMKERLTTEVVFEQIPHVRAQITEAAVAFRTSIRRLQEEHSREIAEVAASGQDEQSARAFYDPSVEIIARFFDDHCRPYFLAYRGERLYLGDTRAASEAFRTLKLNIARQWHRQIDELQDWCDQRRMMDLQTKYQHWLHAWLFVHVPLSFVLLIFTGWHAWVSLRYLATV